MTYDSTDAADGGEPTGDRTAVRTDGGETRTRSDESPATSGSTGLEPNIAAALSYLLMPLTSILFLVVEDDPFVAFHAKQGIVVSVVAFAAWVALGIFGAVLGAFLGLIPVVGEVFGGIVQLLSTGLGLAFFAAWLVLMYKAYTWEDYELPVIGQFASRY